MEHSRGLIPRFMGHIPHLLIDVPREALDKKTTIGDVSDEGGVGGDGGVAEANHTVPRAVMRHA